MSTEREVRVFVSSTFRDMEDERSWLLTHVFPALRAHCRERGVAFVEIDLRWGIEEEDAKNGRTVEVCLEEIERCREHPPFFVGILGERYGWVPRREDVAAYWERRHDSAYGERIARALDQGESVTELEMRFGVLEAPQMREHAYFFLRDPALTEELQQARAADEGEFRDGPSVKLQALKQELRDSGRVILDGYRSLPELGDRLGVELEKAIDLRFPQSEVPDLRQRRDAAHDHFAAVRLEGYLPLVDFEDGLLGRLRAHLAGEAPGPILVTGASGLGKSSLLAHVAGRARDELGATVITHFVGADGERGLESWRVRVLEHLGTETEPPGSTDPWEWFASELTAATAKLSTGIVLMLDGVDQLIDPPGALDRLGALVWPPGVQLVATLADERGSRLVLFETLELRQPTAKERERIIVEVTKSYRHALPKELVGELTGNPACANPLYLRLVLEDLRVHATHQDLPLRLRERLQRPTPARLFEALLRELDEDFAADFPNADHSHPAQELAGLLAASYRGLEDRELAELMAHETDPIDPASHRPRVADPVLRPLLTWMAPYLLRNAGMQALMHAALGAGALPAGQEAPTRRHLIDYFDGEDDRGLTERLYQRARLEDHQGIVADLAAPAHVAALATSDPGVLTQALGVLGAGRAEVSEDLQQLASHWGEADVDWGSLGGVSAVSSLLYGMSFLPLAGAWAEANLAWARFHLPPGHPDIANSLNNLAQAVFAQGRYEEAEGLQREALAVRRQALPAGHPDIATSLSNLANVVRAQGRYEEAERLYKEALEMLRQALPAGHPAIAASVSNLAGVVSDQGRYGEAEGLRREALEIYRQALHLGHPDIAASVSNLATVVFAQGRYGEAEGLLMDALEMRRQALPPGHPDIANSLNNLAQAVFAQGRYEEAEGLQREALEIFRKALPPGHPDIAKSVSNLGGVFSHQGRYDEAEGLYKEALEIYRQALPAGHPDIAVSLSNLGGVFSDQGRYEEAEGLQREALAVRRQALPAGHPDIAVSLNNLAQAVFAQGRYEEAEGLLMDALEMRRQALPPGHPDIATSVSNLANVVQAQGRYGEVEGLYREALDMRRQALPPGHPDIANSLNNLAEAVFAQGRNDEAEGLHREALEMRREALPPGHRAIAASLNNLADSVLAQGRYDEAEGLLREALEISRQALPPGHPDIATSVSNLAIVVSAQGRYDEAEGLYREALDMRRQALPPGHPLIAMSVSNLASVVSDQGRYDEAEGLYREALAIYRQALPPGHPLIASAQDYLAMVVAKRNG